MEIEEAKSFLKEAFIAHPHYSFNNWQIMYDHSLNVLKFALEIAEKVECDKRVLSVGALLHDIGKTAEVDEETLRRDHGKLGWEASKDFVNQLELTPEQKDNLKSILSDAGESLEAQIIEDADIIAFFADKQLQTALNDWAQKRGLPNELQRKLGKMDKLQFSISQEIVRPLYFQMKERWFL